MRALYFILILLTCVSCLKKIEDVESANDNIFDPEYSGDQWWIFEDVYTYTNQNNDQFIRFEIVILEEYAPKLKPPQIDLAVSVNGAANKYIQASVNYTGNYLGVLDINPTGATNFCIDVGVYVEEEDIVINSFTDCKSL